VEGFETDFSLKKYLEVTVTKNPSGDYFPYVEDVTRIENITPNPGVGKSSRTPGFAEKGGNERDAGRKRRGKREEGGWLTVTPWTSTRQATDPLKSRCV